MNHRRLDTSPPMNYQVTVLTTTATVLWLLYPALWLDSGARPRSRSLRLSCNSGHLLSYPGMVRPGGAASELGGLEGWPPTKPVVLSLGCMLKITLGSFRDSHIPKLKSLGVGVRPECFLKFPEDSSKRSWNQDSKLLTHAQERSSVVVWRLSSLGSQRSLAFDLQVTQT